MADLFTKLDTLEGFRAFVVPVLEESPPDLVGIVRSTKSLNLTRVDYAFGEYQQSIQKFAVLLRSKIPDHRKRAGSLLHAVYTSNIISGFEMDKVDLQFIAAGLAPDNPNIIRIISYYSTFHNQLMALEPAFRCCAAYETKPIAPAFDDLHDVCLYLRGHPNVNVETCYMLFDSLMP
jgi:hypothetical protein